MARDAAIRLHDVQPFGLRLDVFDAFAELRGFGNSQHRIPVRGGIILRRQGGRERHGRPQVECFPGRTEDFGRIDQTVSANPNLVAVWHAARDNANANAAATTPTGELSMIRSPEWPAPILFAPEGAVSALLDSRATQKKRPERGIMKTTAQVSP
ncbi:MAG: hypothetical protein ACXW2A_17210, partial [Burkholderiales bacterium]